MSRIKHPPFTLEFMESALRSVGLKAGDRVLVHSSLKNIAPVRQLLALPNTGMDIILQAFKNVLTEQGILAFPTFSSCYSKPEYGPEGHAWDKRETPSRVGSLTDYAWRREGFHRSNHPSHSIAAWGGGTEQFVEGHDYDADTTFGKTTPWGGFWREDFKILFLGTWFNTCTAVHIAEDWLNLPFMAPEAWVWIKTPDGGKKEVKVTGSPWGSRDFYKRKDSKVETRLLKDRLDMFTFAEAGKCKLVSMPFRGLVRSVIEFHYDDPLILLNDPSTDPFAAKYAEAVVRVMSLRRRDDWLAGL